jgi:hypothetical protein
MEVFIGPGKWEPLIHAVPSHEKSKNPLVVERSLGIGGVSAIPPAGQTFDQYDHFAVICKHQAPLHPASTEGASCEVRSLLVGARAY